MIDEGCDRETDGGSPEIVGECTGCRADPASSGIGCWLLGLVVLFRRRRVR
jgi:MYXO-CTERM domain-containing protein